PGSSASSIVWSTTDTTRPTALRPSTSRSDSIVILGLRDPFREPALHLFLHVLPARRTASCPLFRRPARARLSGSVRRLRPPTRSTARRRSAPRRPDRAPAARRPLRPRADTQTAPHRAHH